MTRCAPIARTCARCSAAPMSSRSRARRKSSADCCSRSTATSTSSSWSASAPRTRERWWSTAAASRSYASSTSRALRIPPRADSGSTPSWSRCGSRTKSPIACATHRRRAAARCASSSRKPAAITHTGKPGVVRPCANTSSTRGSPSRRRDVSAPGTRRGSISAMPASSTRASASSRRCCRAPWQTTSIARASASASGISPVA